MKNRSLLVCGAGTMGAGIAQTAAQHGLSVLLFDLSAPVLKKAEEQIRQRLENLVQKQKISESAFDSILQSIEYTTDISLCKAPVLLEAIVEKLSVKTKLFEELAALNGPSSIYATNTSSLSVEEIADAHPYPSQVAGMHFFNPAPLMKLVEVVTTSHTSPAVVRKITELATSMGKTPVICKDAPGFIVNRVARPFYIEALRLAEQGVSISLIDDLMEAAGFKMGPFRLMDLIGNDVNYAVSCSVYEQLGKPERLRPSSVQEQKVKEGKLGRKTGAGYYTYKS
ncbi:3-hydroxyacyl-CoA dehydrogenase NAD-binding domain-containing protein [Flavihumibacter cheonanensis]|uniref:3-hydroxyacyl-CoA dehydrogenase NAD-binding domain-containing protein n=1 Tax=Flavihumibacter cheonanensis TaxID=1442385 RepID=UPI001EF908AF|nr:3-hydroxyacyl-CoA dehydrogenase NAD-binding domain-containing protein [Flavihumibacter cheonanensis]MCG7754679.1 3-hydroxyacyl-CoA dehydrogenase NAD-binding domain-containing protein [Flavihumibacter cheonanensis]